MMDGEIIIVVGGQLASMSFYGLVDEIWRNRALDVSLIHNADLK